MVVFKCSQDPARAGDPFKRVRRDSRFLTASHSEQIIALAPFGSTVRFQNPFARRKEWITRIFAVVCSTDLGLTVSELTSDHGKGFDEDSGSSTP